ncbi:MAG: glycosyltransferase family 2 protein [Solirubrobacteraceae bacterium]
MTISVVIPTYNRSALVREAIASALAQDPPVLEVLVCDNGSTDDTVERVRELPDPRVRVLPAVRGSGGPAAPRNHGLREARGEWVALLDDDDRWLPGKIAGQLPHLTAADLVAANGLRTSDGRPYFAAAPRPEMLARDNVIITSTVLVRTSLLRAAGGFPERPGWQGVEDYATWLRLADHGARMVILGEPLIDYRDEGADRFGTEAAEKLHRQLASLHARRWAARPYDVRRARVALGAQITARRG